jgi:hypothetical protein
VVIRWLTVLVAGSIVAILPGEFSTSLPPGRVWQATAALDAVVAVVVLTGVAVVTGGLAALPALVRFLRAGGWPKIRRRVACAAGATVAASGGLAGLVMLSRSMTSAQLSRSLAYALVLIVTTVALVAAIGWWAAATAVMARQLNLAPRVRAVELMLAAAITTAVSVAVGLNALWLSASQSSVTWLLVGMAQLALVSTVVPARIRHAIRSGRRARRTVSH